MADFVRSREILEMKMQIHNEIGQALLATRAWLQSQEDGGESRLFKQWEAIIALMRAEAEPKQGKTDWEIFCRCTQAAGVEIRLDGKVFRQFSINHTQNAECLSGQCRIVKSEPDCAGYFFRCCFLQEIKHFFLCMEQCLTEHLRTEEFFHTLPLSF